VSEDIWAGAFTAEGVTLWNYTYDGAAQIDDQARGITIADNGDILIAGFVGVQDGNTPSSDAWIQRLTNEQGVPVWDSPVVYVGPEGPDVFNDIVVSTDKVIVASGYAEYLGKTAPLVSFFQESGVSKYNELASEPEAGELYGVTSATNHIVTCGARTYGETVRTLLRSYKQGPKSEDFYAPDDGWTYAATTCLFDPLSGLMLTTASGSDPLGAGEQHDLMTYQFSDADGELTWLSSETVVGLTARGLAVDPATSDRVTCGRTFVDDGPAALWVRRASATNYADEEYWDFQAPGVGSTDNEARAVAVAPDGTIVAVGEVSSDLNGREIWIAKFAP
jgi:hypothetical protein